MDIEDVTSKVLFDADYYQLFSAVMLVLRSFAPAVTP